MKTSFSELQTILRKELLIPVSSLHSQQVLSTDLGLSAFEVNVLLYYIEEKYHMEFNITPSALTVKELVSQMEGNKTAQN